MDEISERSSMAASDDGAAPRLESSESSSSGRRATVAASVRRSVLGFLGPDLGSTKAGTSVPEFAPVPEFAAAAAMGRPMSGAALTSSLSSGERSPRRSRSSFDDRSLRPQGEEARRGSSFADQAREESLSRLNRARSRQQSVKEAEGTDLI